MLENKQLRPGQRFIFVFDQIPPGLNGSRNKKTGHPGGLLRMHWSQRAKILDAYIWHIKAQMPEVGLETGNPPLIKHCNIFYIIRSVQMMDFDNAHASFKILGDALKLRRDPRSGKEVGAGVIFDDSLSVIENFYPTFLKVAHREQQGCEVVVEVLPVDKLGRLEYTLKHLRAQEASVELDIEALR